MDSDQLSAISFFILVPKQELGNQDSKDLNFCLLKLMADR
jgi:hypothetical protein